jgi:hypothetical protein
MTMPFAAAFAVGEAATLAERCLAQLPSAGKARRLASSM